MCTVGLGTRHIIMSANDVALWISSIIFTTTFIFDVE